MKSSPGWWVGGDDFFDPERALQRPTTRVRAHHTLPTSRQPEDKS